MDTDVSHAQLAINNDVEERLNAIEAHLGLAKEEDVEDDEDTEDEDTEDGE